MKKAYVFQMKICVADRARKVLDIVQHISIIKSVAVAIPHIVTGVVTVAFIVFQDAVMILLVYVLSVQPHVAQDIIKSKTAQEDQTYNVPPVLHALQAPHTKPKHALLHQTHNAQLVGLVLQVLSTWIIFVGIAGTHPVLLALHAQQDNTRQVAVMAYKTQYVHPAPTMHGLIQGLHLYRNASAKNTTMEIQVPHCHAYSVHMVRLAQAQEKQHRH